MTSPHHDPNGDFAFAEGHRLGLSWTLRAATGDQVREVLVGSLDPVRLADWDAGVDFGNRGDADRFRAGFVGAAGRVVSHLRNVTHGDEPWAFGDLQPDAVGVFLRLRGVSEAGRRETREPALGKS